MTDTIVVCTDDSGRFDTALTAAVERANADGSRIILYDVTAPTTFTSPRPNIWAGEGAEEMYDHPLDPIELEKLGRHNVALKVKEARERGADAYGWLPEKASGQALADYARAEGARLILVPHGLPDEAPDVFNAVPETAPPIEYVE